VNSKEIEGLKKRIKTSRILKDKNYIKKARTKLTRYEEK
jgi:hypothetical protein